MYQKISTRTGTYPRYEAGRLRENGYEAWLADVSPKPLTEKGKAAVIGGGPAGMAAAYFLRRGGMEVTLFEQTGSLGGVVRHVIPEFRIPGSSIDKDAEILKAAGVDVQYNTKVESVQQLKEQGYGAVIFAVGAYKSGMLKLEPARR